VKYCKGQITKRLTKCCDPHPLAPKLCIAFTRSASVYNCLSIQGKASAARSSVTPGRKIVPGSFHGSLKVRESERSSTISLHSIPGLFASTMARANVTITYSVMKGDWLLLSARDMVLA
jgi:hypothetical protein